MGAKNEEKKGKRETAAPFANNNTNAHPASPGKNMNIIFFSLPFPSSPASFLPYLLQDLPRTTTTEKPPFVRTRVCDLTTPRQPSPPPPLPFPPNPTSIKTNAEKKGDQVDFSLPTPSPHRNERDRFACSHVKSGGGGEEARKGTRKKAFSRLLTLPARNEKERGHFSETEERSQGFFLPLPPHPLPPSNHAGHNMTKNKPPLLLGLFVGFLGSRSRCVWPISQTRFFFLVVSERSFPQRKTVHRS